MIHIRNIFLNSKDIKLIMYFMQQKLEISYYFMINERVAIFINFIINDNKYFFYLYQL